MDQYSTGPDTGEVLATAVEPDIYPVEDFVDPHEIPDSLYAMMRDITEPVELPNDVEEGK